MKTENATRDQSLTEILDSINTSINDIEEHPVKVDPKNNPSNFEILLSGMSNSAGIEKLFSPEVDNLINKMFSALESGNLDDMLKDEDTLKSLLSSIGLGEGSFEGPVSKNIISSIQTSVNSQRYQTMKSHLGKTMTMIKKMHFIIKNLEYQERYFKNNKDMLKKYKDAVYAIKRVLKIVAKIYYNRKIVNKRVYNGINNIVHEDSTVDEKLIKIE
jgi:hypothetical protein